MRGLRVTDHTFRSARIMPGLCASATRRLGIDNFINPVAPCRLDQHRIGLLVIPRVRVAGPFSPLLRQKTSFDPAARFRIAASASKANDLINTVRSGNAQLPRPEYLTVESSGSATNRSLWAPSLHNCALTE